MNSTTRSPLTAGFPILKTRSKKKREKKESPQCLAHWTIKNQFVNSSMSKTEQMFSVRSRALKQSGGSSLRRKEVSQHSLSTYWVQCIILCSEDIKAEEPCLVDITSKGKLWAIRWTKKDLLGVEKESSGGNVLQGEEPFRSDLGKGWGTRKE